MLYDIGIFLLENLGIFSFSVRVILAVFGYFIDEEKGENFDVFLKQFLFFLNM